MEWWVAYFASERGYDGVTSITIGDDGSWGLIILPNEICTVFASHVNVITVDSVPQVNMAVSNKYGKHRQGVGPVVHFCVPLGAISPLVLVMGSFTGHRTTLAM